MKLFVFAKKQRICNIGGIKIGGQPGDNPPVVIGSMFHEGDHLVEDRSARSFNRARAADLIKRQEQLSEETGIPALVDLEARTADEMKAYLDFYLGVSDAPFAIDMWNAKARMEVARHIASLGIQDKVLYNSLTHFDNNLADSATELKGLGFRHVVVQTYQKAAMLPEETLKSLDEMLTIIGPDTFDSVLVDTASVNLPAIAFSCLASRLVKERFGLPAGCCPTAGTFSWKKARALWGEEGLKVIDVAEHALSSLMWNDFLFCGPIARAPRMFPALAATEMIRAVFRAYETGNLPEERSNPLNLFFDDFADKWPEKLRGES